MANKDSDSLSTQQMVNSTLREIAKDYNAGQRPATMTPTLTVPPHLQGLVNDNVAETRARLAAQDRNLHGMPPKAQKP